LSGKQLLTFIFRVKQFKKVEEERELFLRCLTMEMKVLCEISGFCHKVDEDALFWGFTQ
jgi:hypothetical protein